MNDLIVILEMIIGLNKADNGLSLTYEVTGTHLRVIIEAERYMVTHTVVFSKEGSGETIDKLYDLLVGISSGTKSPMELIPYCSVKRGA